MKKLFMTIGLSLLTAQASAEDLKTPADMSPEAQDKMYQFVTDYNRCMMQTRLQSSQGGQDAQSAAQDILQSCENHLDSLKAHLATNEVDQALTEGMAKRLRSKAARQLMTKTMNNLAAQAAAMENAQKVSDTQ